MNKTWNKIFIYLIVLVLVCLNIVMTRAEIKVVSYSTSHKKNSVRPYVCQFLRDFSYAFLDRSLVNRFLYEFVIWRRNFFIWIKDTKSHLFIKKINFLCNIRPSICLSVTIDNHIAWDACSLLDRIGEPSSWRDHSHHVVNLDDVAIL